MPPKASFRVKLPPKQKKNDTLHDPVEYVGHGGSHGGERVESESYVVMPVSAQAAWEDSESVQL